jgi:hypothetical protein
LYIKEQIKKLFSLLAPILETGPMKNIHLAIKKVFQTRSYLLIFFVSAAALFLSLVAMPLFTIPGNTIAFQLKIFTTQNYLLMAFLSTLAGLNLALSWYGFAQQKKLGSTSQSIAGGAVSTITGIFGAVVGTASCLSCLVALLGLVGLGVGSALFILKNQSYFLFGAIALMLCSLYFAARKVNKVCTSC